MITKSHQNAPTDVVLPLAMKELPARKLIALQVVVIGGTDAEAAAKAGVRRETVHRWRHLDRAFKRALDSAQARVWQKHVDDLQTLLPLAVRDIGWALDSANPALRLRAADLLLRVCHAAKESAHTACSSKMLPSR